MMENLSIAASSVRQLCIERNYFTHGDNEQYERVLSMVYDRSPREIAVAIWICSDTTDSIEVIEDALNGVFSWFK